MFTINYHNFDNFFNKNFQHLKKYQKNYILYFLNTYYDRICKYLIIEKGKQLDKDTILSIIIFYIGVSLETNSEIIDNCRDNFYDEVKSYIEHMCDTQYNLKMQDVMKQFNNLSLTYDSGKDD